MNNIEAAEKGFARLKAVSDEYGIEVVVSMTIAFGTLAREIHGRAEGAYVAAIIGRVAADEWAFGVELAAMDHKNFMAKTLALLNANKADG